MGSYCTELISNEQVTDIIRALQTGYEHKGVKHRSNFQVATIMILQANLGCRIGDIVHLEVENIKFDGEAWRLDMTEEKTGKTRRFIVPTPVKAVIDDWCSRKSITTGRLFSIEEPAVWKQLRAVTAYLDMKNVSCHSFRKNACFRIYMDSGKDIAMASQFLQHSNTSVTLLYLRRSDKQMDELLSNSFLTV